MEEIVARMETQAARCNSRGATPRGRSRPSASTTTRCTDRRRDRGSLGPGTRRLILLFGPAAAGSPGGGEIQLQETARALSAAGLEVRLLQHGEALPRRADCLHLFGSHAGHLPVVAAARRSGIPVALSPIAWFDLRSYWREPGGLGRRLARCGRFLARAACPTLPSWRRRLYRAVDLLLPNSTAEADQLVRYFGLPRSKIHVTPNGAGERFAGADAEPFAELVGIRGFVLYAGRIEPRKNQLNFLRAMRGSGIPIVVLGDVLHGHEQYLDKCRRAADRRVRFVPRMDHEDPRLGSAYAACGCLALASWYETPGLVALEAGMSGTPLVLPQRGAAREYFGHLAQYVRPDDLPGIRRAVGLALSGGRSPALAEHVQRNFSWKAAAQATCEAYARIV